MGKKIFKEQQRFRNWEIIALLVFFMLGLTVKFIGQNWVAPVEDAMPLLTYAILMLPLAASLWYVLSLRLSVRVSEKGLSLKYSSWYQKRQKIRWEDVEEAQLLQTSGLAQWSGGNISFENEKNFSLCGRTGLHLKTKQGENIIIGARRFGEFRDAISQVFPRALGA